MIIGSRLIFLGNLPSTNTHALQLLRDGDVSEGTVIRTNFQTAGRGHGFNTWDSETDKNLLISIILFPSMLHPEEQFLLSMSVSLGICDFLEDKVSGISIKWPNDIYVKDDKIAGILIENSIMGQSVENSVVGIGLNINQEIFRTEVPNPVSLRQLTGQEYDLTMSLNQMLQCLDRRYKSLIGGEYSETRKDYRKSLYKLGVWANYRDDSGLFVGRLTDVADNGILKVERKNGKVSSYSFKEIEFIL